jgi:hypothetical protein
MGTLNLRTNAGGSVIFEPQNTATDRTLFIPAANGIMATTDQLSGFKNRMINGDMRIWQRGTSFTFNSGYTTDRFQVHGPTTNQWIVTQSGSAARVTYNVSGAFGHFGQAIEANNIDDLVGQTVTLSFDVRSSVNQTGSIQVTDTPGPQSGTSNLIATGLTYPITTSFNRVSVTFTMPSSIQYACVYVILNPVATWTLGSWIEFKNVQLERGSVATPFERRPYGTELALCQRYFESVVLNSEMGSLSINGSFIMSAVYPYSTKKRTNPTMTSNMTNANYSTQWGLAQAGFTVSDKTGTVSIGIQSTDLGFAFNFTGATFSPTPIAIRTGWNSPFGSPIINANAEL